MQHRDSAFAGKLHYISRTPESLCRLAIPDDHQGVGVLGNVFPRSEERGLRIASIV